MRLLLLSGIGKPYDPATGEGVVGKNYAYQITSSVNVFFDDKILNPFVGAGALGIIINDFNGDNFDHSGLGFIGGGYVGVLQTGARPIETHPTPTGTPAWGADWKKAIARQLPEDHHHRDPRRGDEPPRQLPGPRSRPTRTRSAGRCCA